MRLATNDAYKDSHGLQFSQCVLSMATQHRTLLYCLMSAATLYTRTARNTSDESLLDRHVTAKAVQLLNQQMADPCKAVCESNIWAVVVMAHCSEMGELRVGKLPQQSTLKELQSLHIYGRLTVNQIHLQGLSQLIAMLGGLDKLSTPGMASAIS